MSGSDKCPRCGAPYAPGTRVCEYCASESAPSAPARPAGQAAAPPGAQVTDVAGAASKKIPAAICGILLGGLGIHKFILGYAAEGVIMLLVSLIAGSLTCGVAYLVMWVFGLIEGIIYLTKSDEEFVRTYVQNKRGWF